jgi:hypothetical protein
MLISILLQKSNNLIKRERVSRTVINDEGRQSGGGAFIVVAFQQHAARLSVGGHPENM